ncbi:hypothetical protein GLOIN_2v1525822, partial [Rhizophagus irregularis DAOM 181602=DAOM 197198]
VYIHMINFFRIYFVYISFFKNELLIKYMEFVYGIYRNVHKIYTKRILSVYIFLI